MCLRILSSLSLNLVQNKPAVYACADYFHAMSDSTVCAMNHYDQSILVIDDQSASVALLLEYLTDKGLDVWVALGGADGLRKAIAGVPDAILLDVSMPGLDGYSVCRALKREPATAHIPVLFLSASATIEDKLQGFAAGGVDYIGKPFSEEEVLARLFVHLRLALRSGASAVDRPAVERELHRDQDFLAAAIVELQRDGLVWPGLAELARSAGTNEKKLTELFRQRFGMTAYEYQVDLRLEGARAALAGTVRQIQQIAHLAGYLNASDFSRAFRQRFGLGPREYRRVSQSAASTRPADAAAEALPEAPR